MKDPKAIIRIVAVVVAAAVIGVSVPADAASRTGVWAVGHVQNIGWQAPSNVEIGTTGRSLRLEAIQVQGRNAKVWCQAHVQNIGWMEPVSDGQVCGTTGRSLRLEAVRLWTEGDEPAKDALSTFTAVGDIGVETAGLNNLSKIGSRGNPLLILGDLGYTVPATEFCSALTARVSQPVMWVQGNHENRDADLDTAETDDYAVCMPTYADSVGEVGIQQVYKMPGAWVITASPQEAEAGTYLPGGAGYEWVQGQIRAAQDAGVWPILAFHEPHYTVGSHGPAGAESKALSQLAVDEGVRLVLTAHDHIYARTTVEDTTFVVAGMGGRKPLTPSRVSGWTSCTGATGFVTFTVYEDRIVGHVTDTCPDDWTITKND